MRTGQSLPRAGVGEFEGVREGRGVNLKEPGGAVGSEFEGAWE